jgi:hypothetical protein
MFVDVADSPQGIADATVSSASASAGGGGGGGYRQRIRSAVGGGVTL